MDPVPLEHSHLPRFDLDVFLDPAAYQIRVRGSVIVPATAAPRETLEFLLRTDVEALRIEVLDPSVCRGPVEVRLSEQVPNMAATQRLLGELPAPCPSGVPLVLSVAYECGSEEDRRWLTITSDFSFSSAYASAWLPMFGYRRGTGTFRYSVPRDDIVVAATGRRSSVDQQDARMVHSFVTAGPAVFDFVAAPFTVQRREGRVPVSVYYLQPLDDAAEILMKTERIIGVLEEEFGPYPFDELAVVEIPMDPAVYAGVEGGAYPGYFLLRSDLLHADGFEDWVVGHELTHFWFPHVVGHQEEPAAPAMLDEALAHYGALRVVEALGGPATAEEFRREGGAEAIRLTGAGFHHALAGPPSTDRWDRVAYNFSNTKGHLVYDMLARTVGRERFQAGLQRVIRDRAGHDITWSDFWSFIEHDASQPLAWFYAQWLDGRSLPVLSLDWRQLDHTLTCTVTQAEPSFRLDLPLQIEFSDGTSVMHAAGVAGERTDIDIPIEKDVHSVRLDPHHTILHATPAQWEEAVARRSITRGKMLWEDDDVDRALETLLPGLEELPDVDVWGIEFSTRLQVGWIYQQQAKLDEALTEYETALACAVRPADELARLYLNFATIARERGDHERFLWAVKNALTVEQTLGKDTEITREARAMMKDHLEPPAG